jgi:uncharacterized membrane protein YidH (DUF202 family)
MKKITKNLLSLVFVLSILVLPSAAILAAGTPNVGISDVETSGLNLGNQTPMKTATTLINTAMMFLGLIAVVIILMGGFKWMTAGGSEDKITEARKLMTAGIIGIVIILSAWGIASWVLNQSVNLTTGSSVNIQ